MLVDLVAVAAGGVGLPHLDQRPWTGRPSPSSSRPVTTIRSPSGSPACCRVRSWSCSATRPSPSNGPVTSVRVWGSGTSGRSGARSLVARYAGCRYGGWSPATAGRLAGSGMASSSGHRNQPIGGGRGGGCADPGGDRGGGGPAGLLLSQLLHLEGVSSVVLELRSREYVEQRVRAGVLEQGTVELLEAAGVAGRLRREGMVHHGSSCGSAAAATVSRSRS